MGTNRFDLNVEVRNTGKGNSRGLRSNKKIPAVVYGALKNNVNVALDENTVRRFSATSFENALFNLKSNESSLNNIVVLMKDVSVHPVTRRPLHVDLFALDLKKAVRVSIEIKVEGKPVGIADGGLLNVVNRTIEIECLPTAIPESVVVDVSALGVGDALHVSDLTLPAGVKLISSADLTIAVVNMAEEESLTPTPAATADAAAPGAAAPAAGAAAAAPAKDAKAAAPAKDDKKK